MQIIRLEISNYKCLKDFSINFKEDYEKGFSKTVLIGENGSGKSSIIEAITMILMSYDSPSIARQVDFSYELDYIFAGCYFNLSYDVENGVYSVIAKEDPNTIIFNLTYRSFNVLKRNLHRYNIRLFPLNIITYYSGSDERLERLNRQLDIVYARRIRNYLDYCAKYEIRVESYPKKKYWYYKNELAIPIMLASLLSKDNDAIMLKGKLNISNIASFQIEFDLRSLMRYTDTIISTKESSQMEDFWEVLNALDYQICRNLKRSKVILAENSLVIHVTNFSKWKNDKYSILEFLDKLSLTFDVNYDLKLNIGSQVVDYFDLSEGQRQLVNTLGMLTICKAQDSLVLMDEPDVYLNPRWKYEYLNYLEESAQGSINTQILISTHDPLMINGLEKEYIRKFELKHFQGNIKTVVYYPIEETIGLGIDGLLQSGYYGLKTSYDSYTSNRYEKRAELFSKLINAGLNEEEELELTNLTKELNGLPVMNSSIDYLYDDFMREYRNSRYYLEEYLTGEQVKKRNKDISKLIDKLFEEKG